MELKKSDYLVQVYKNIFDEYPTNICSFFWGTVWVFINFLTTVIGIVQIFLTQYLYNKLEDKNEYYGDLTINLTYAERVFQIIFSGYLISNRPLATTNYIIVDYIIFAISIYLIFGVLLIVGYFIEIIIIKVKRKYFKRNKGIKRPNLITSYLKGVKNKYCEIITYK